MLASLVLVLLTATPCSTPVGTPVRSPDGHVRVFISRDSHRKDETALGPVDHEDLCLSRDEGPPTVLLEGRGLLDGVGPDRSLAAFEALLFAPDGKTLFFTTSGWVTSPAAHAVELSTGRERFLFDGAVVAVVGKHFLASHYRLDPKYPVDSPKYRGRMETWSLVTREGKVLRAVSDEEAARLSHRP